MPASPPRRRATGRWLRPLSRPRQPPRRRSALARRSRWQNRGRKLGLWLTAKRAPNSCLCPQSCPAGVRLRRMQRTASRIGRSRGVVFWKLQAPGGRNTSGHERRCRRVANARRPVRSVLQRTNRSMPRHRKASGASLNLLESSARPIYLVSDQRAVLFLQPRVCRLGRHRSRGARRCNVQLRRGGHRPHGPCGRREALPTARGIRGDRGVRLGLGRVGCRRSRISARRVCAARRARHGRAAAGGFGGRGCRPV